MWFFGQSEGQVGGWGKAEILASEPDGQTGVRWQTWATYSHEGEGPAAASAMDKSIFDYTANSNSAMSWEFKLINQTINMDLEENANMV